MSSDRESGQIDFAVGMAKAMSSDTPRVCHCSLPSMDPTACSRCGVSVGLTVAADYEFHQTCLTPDKCRQFSRDLAAAQEQIAALKVDLSERHDRVAALKAEVKMARVEALREIEKVIRRNRDEWGCGDRHDGHNDDLSAVTGMIAKEDANG